MSDVARSASPPERRSRSASPLREGKARAISRSPSASRSPVRRSLSPKRRSVSPRRRASRSPSRCPDPNPSFKDRRRRSPSYSRSRSRSRSRDRQRRSRSPRYERRSRSPVRRSGGASYAMPPRTRTPPRVGLQMFVSGLNFACDEREVEHKFSKYGRVKEVRIVRNPLKYNESKGFGFVVMESERSVQDAIKDLDGRDWNGRRLLVEVARNPR